VAEQTKPKGKVGRPKSGGKKIVPTFTPEQVACLERLVEFGYAATPAEVVRYLVQRAIDDMKRNQLLAPKVSTGDGL
jgi:hypothetical protein